MAIISIFPDRNIKLHTYYLEEVHYVFYPRLTYLALEGAICPEDTINQFQFCVHGGIIWDNSEIANIMETKRAYKELFDLSKCSITPQNGIYDFRNTWFQEDLITNKGYEGPREFNQIEVTVLGQSIKYYGCSAETPLLRFDVEASDICSFVNVSRQDEDDFSGNSIFPFRLGFFLQWPRQESVEKDDKGYYKYPLHVFTYTSSEQDQLRRRPLISNFLRPDRCNLYVSLDPFVSKYIQESEQPANEKMQELDKYRDEPTTDIWFVVRKEDDAFLPTELLEGQPEKSLRPTRHGLYSDTQTRDLPYKEYHLHLKLNIRAYSQTRHINPHLHDLTSVEVSWFISFFSFNLKSLWAKVKSNINILAVILAIIAVVVIPTVEYKTGIIFTAGIVFIYLLICTGIVWFETRR